MTPFKKNSTGNSVGQLGLRTSLTGTCDDNTAD